MLMNDNKLLYLQAKGRLISTYKCKCAIWLTPAFKNMQQLKLETPHSTIQTVSLGPHNTKKMILPAVIYLILPAVIYLIFIILDWYCNICYELKASSQITVTTKHPHLSTSRLSLTPLNPSYTIHSSLAEEDWHMPIESSQYLIKILGNLISR